MGQALEKVVRMHPHTTEECVAAGNHCNSNVEKRENRCFMCLGTLVDPEVHRIIAESGTLLQEMVAGK